MITSDVLLGNDSDLDGHPLQLVRVRSSDVRHGKVTQIDDKNWAYFPTRGVDGVTEQIRYNVTDDVTGDSSVEGWLSLVIAAYNEPNRSPVAAPAAFKTYDSVPFGAPSFANQIDFNIAYFITDPDGDFMIFRDMNKPMYGRWRLCPLQQSLKTPGGATHPPLA